MRMNPLIALFTDFGTRDAYVAQMKGAILTICPHARLVDLNHEAGQFDVRGAAYVLAASAAFFPAQTIVVAVVDPGVGSERRPVVLQTASDKWFVGPDNGLFTHVMEREGFRRAAVLDRPAYYRAAALSATFHGRDIFGPSAAHLAAGIDPELLGSAPSELLLTLPRRQPRQVGQALMGEVQHIDHYGNVVTNLTPELLHAWLTLAAGVPRTQISGVPRTKIYCLHRSETYAVRWVNTYADGEPGALLGLLNSDRFFEFAMARGSAKVFLDAAVGDGIELWPSEDEKHSIS
jgi:S-adenosylmethionine hydrolase